MAQEYQPRRFFRHAPNGLLKLYFAAHAVLSDVDFGVLTAMQVGTDLRRLTDADGRSPRAIGETPV